MFILIRMGGKLCLFVIREGNAVIDIEEGEGARLATDESELSLEQTPHKPLS